MDPGVSDCQPTRGRASTAAAVYDRAQNGRGPRHRDSRPFDRPTIAPPATAALRGRPAVRSYMASSESPSSSEVSVPMSATTFHSPPTFS